MNMPDEVRPLTAGQLLNIRRSVRADTADPLEEAVICNAKVLSRSCFLDGELMFADEQAVLERLTFPEMEQLLELLSSSPVTRAERKPLPAAANPQFDMARFRYLQRGGTL